MFSLIEKIKSFFRKIMTWIRIKIFGDNNERLDFFVDSFNKLDQTKKYIVGGIGVFSLFCLVGGIFFLYFWQVSNLKSGMNQGFAALHSLQRIHAQHISTDAEFKDLTQQLTTATSGLKFKPMIETISNELGVKVRNLKDIKSIDFSAENPLRGKFKKAGIQLEFDRISIPKLIKFVEQIDKQNKFLSIQEIDIGEIYKTRLYFKAKITVTGYLRG